MKDLALSFVLTTERVHETHLPRRDRKKAVLASFLGKETHGSQCAHLCFGKINVRIWC